MKDEFKDCFEVTADGKFIIDQQSTAARRHLLRQLNDNVFQNIEKRVAGVRKYSQNSDQQSQKSSISNVGSVS